jgi:PAS domain S-box-containing protein
VPHHKSLMDQLASHVKHGDHLCVICESQEDKLKAAAQYIADGLRQNEFVMYAADKETTQQLKNMLAEGGIDVEREVARGALNLPTAYDVYLMEGEFKPDIMYAAFEKAIDDALAAGYTGCRFAGEPVWAIEKESLRPGLIEFESRLNQLFRNRKAAGLCVYDKQSWPAEVVRDVLRVHPIAVVDDMVCERNLYYERPDLATEEGAADFQVKWMLSQLREWQAQESKLQIALEAGNLGSWELDLRSDTSIRSLRHDQIFGYDRLLPEWGYETFMQHVLPEDRNHVDRAFRNSLESGQTWHFECRIRRHGDETIRWIEAHGRPVSRGVAQPPEKLMGIVADITERKELEQALREADQRKDAFLATLAHELRNPLAPISNALQLMQLKNSSDPQLQRIQSVIDRQVKHLVRLVDDLLEVSRISTGRIVLQQEQIELQAVLSSAIEASQPLIDASSHRLSISLPKEPIYLRGDATRLAQVFLNVLNNAAKYTPQGGHIALKAEREEDQVVIYIRDNGLGIHPALIEDMFKMFVQGHRSGERAQGGLGIGLPLARQLLQLHGGSISARSEGPRKGSEFIIRLPVLIKQSKPTEAPCAEKADETSGAHILLVDDNRDAADILAENFEVLGYRMTTCYDASSALSLLARINPDIAILDIGLPDMDGYTLAQRIRETKPHITLVALTGWGQEKDKMRASEAGFDLHRTKPVEPMHLLAAVARHLHDMESRTIMAPAS